MEIPQFISDTFIRDSEHRVTCAENAYLSALNDLKDAEVRASLAKQRLDAEKQHLENLKNLYIKG